ncbi:unnamed protein product [Camellia sinensis]
MDDNVVQRVFQEGGRDFYQQPSSSSSSIIQSLPLYVLSLCLLITKLIDLINAKELNKLGVSSFGQEHGGLVVFLRFLVHLEINYLSHML